LSNVVYSAEGYVGVVTIDRPERANSLTFSMIERELPEIWSEIGSDPKIRSAVLTASPGRFFCAGMDVKDPEIVASSLGERPIPRLGATAKQNGVFKPVVAAVGGLCLGGGLMLVGDADVVIGSEHASFGNPAVSIGQVATVGPMMLAKRGHFDAALRMTLLGSKGILDAQEALRLGLISELVPQRELSERALLIASEIASNSPAAVQASLRNLWSSIDLSIDAAVDSALATTHQWRNHPDASEGLTANAEGRPARWSDDDR
jgi:enoyl-CoA hydratase/carnithine racemase